MSSSCMSTPLHTSQHTTKAITTMGYKLFSLILLYSPHIPPSDFCIFSPFKDELQGCHLVKDEKLKHSTCQELQHFRQEFYKTGIRHLIQRWKSVSIMKETLWKNHLNFVKNLPIIHKLHCNSNHSL